MIRVRLKPLNDDGRAIELVNEITLIGREEWCDLTIEHKSVSKMHCCLAQNEHMVYVRDLGSTNGTRVNDHRVRRAVLLHNDELSIAGRKFRVLIGEDSDFPVTQAIDENHPFDPEADGDFQIDPMPASGPSEPAFRRNHLPDQYGQEPSSAPADSSIA